MAEQQPTKPDQISYFENHYFDWRCTICKLIAIRPQLLEDQHLFEHGPHKDINGTKWYKCHTCNQPFHLECLQIPANTQRGIWNCLVCEIGDQSDESDECYHSDLDQNDDNDPFR
jgi:hypothetical protein